KGWSDNAGPERGPLASALDRLDAPSALRVADQAWSSGARDAALFRQIAHGYAMLELETPPSAATSDVLASRALAALAYARARGAGAPTREACLVASVMGYSAAATDLASKLGARDPLRLYVTWDDAGLVRAAAAALPQTTTPAARNAPAKSLEAP